MCESKAYAWYLLLIVCLHAHVANACDPMCDPMYLSIAKEQQCKGHVPELGHPPSETMAGGPEETMKQKLLNPLLSAFTFETCTSISGC